MYVKGMFSNRYWFIYSSLMHYIIFLYGVRILQHCLCHQINYNGLAYEVFRALLKSNEIYNAQELISNYRNTHEWRCFINLIFKIIKIVTLNG